MKIHGLQKMTLLDFPGHVACTVFLGGCDLRCPFCHNFDLADGTAQPVMDDEELLGFLKKRKGLLDGVAFTGGEPCLHKELPELMRKIRDLGFGVKLDSNGCHPEMLASVLEEGLVDYVAMGIKNSPAKYALTSGLDQLDLAPVLESIDILRSAGRAGGSLKSGNEAGLVDADAAAGGFDYEFRTTVVKEFHEDADFEEIGKMISGASHYFLQCFTDRDSVPFEGLHAPSKEDLERYAAIARKYVPDTQLRGVD